MSRDVSLPAFDLAAALSGLDQATRDFNRRLSEAQGVAARAAGALPPEPQTRVTASPFEAKLLEAEREARRYLERAKQRADSLVAAMVGAVEHEAAEIRHEAEEGIRARWQQVEADARQHLDEAVRVGNGIVAERQQQLAVLSDGIAGKAEILSAGLEDADRIRIQFEAFVRALAVTADRIAQQSGAGSGRVLAELRDFPRNPRPSAIAA